MMHATPSSSTYRTMKHPASPGDVRRKVWPFLIPPVASDDPTWVQRCKDYWELQQETFGLKLSDFSMVVLWDDGYILTACVVLDVLPGERTPDYVAPRKRH